MPFVTRSRLTEPMAERIVALWKTGISTTEMGVILHGEFPEYPGTLDRNGVSALVFRMRSSTVKKYHLPRRTGVGMRAIRKSNERADPKTPVRSNYRPKAALGPGQDQRKSARGGSMMSGDGIPKEPLSKYDSAFTCEHKPKTLFELEPNECRWPIDHEGKSGYYCGLPGRPYCVDHKRMVHK